MQGLGQQFRTKVQEFRLEGDVECLGSSVGLGRFLRNPGKSEGVRV